MKIETRKLYFRVFRIFLPNVIKIDPYNFYRAMHFSAKRGIAIDVVRPSVCDVGGL